MKNVKMTILYMIKSFWRLLIPTLPVAICMALILNPLNSVISLYDFTITPVYGSAEIFNAFGYNFVWTDIFKYLAFILIATVFLSYAYIAVYRHFRVGKFSIRNPLPYINGGFFPILKTILVICAYTVGYETLLVFVLILFNSIIAPVSYILFLVITYALVIGGFVFGVRLLSVPLLMVAQMCIYGYSTIEAWNCCNRIPFKNLEIFLATLVPLILLLVVNFVINILSLDFVFEIILNTLCYVLILSYFITLSLTLTFSYSQLERKDLRRLAFW